MSIADGFERQRMVVVPPPAVEGALLAPVTRRLVVTAAGYFPEARGHGRTRETGITDNIVILCVSGSGWAEVGNENLRVTSSSALVIPAGLPHRYGSSKDAAWTIWWCHIRGGDASELIRTVIGSRSNAFPLRDMARVAPFVENILSELERDTLPLRLVGAAGAAWNLLTHIATDGVLRDRGEPVERAIAYLEDTLDTSVRVPELASMVGVSSSHLSALFKRATGGGILRYQTELRMARARHLLDSTPMSVGSIAEAVGYSDPLYFSRQFLKSQGQGPRDYRNRPRGETSGIG